MNAASQGSPHLISSASGSAPYGDVRMKSGTGRAQDASDVDALRRIQETLRGR